MNEINRLCLRNQQIIDTVNELNARLVVSKATYPVLALQPFLANLLSSSANLLAFKEKIFYPHRKKYLAAGEDYNLVANFTKELSITHQAVNTYRMQWSNYYHVRNNHSECLVQTKLVLESIVRLARYEIDHVAPLLSKEAIKQETVMRPGNYNNLDYSQTEIIN